MGKIARKSESGVIIQYCLLQVIHVHFIERFFGVAPIAIAPEPPIVNIIHGMTTKTNIRQFNLFSEFYRLPVTKQTIDAFVRTF